MRILVILGTPVLAALAAAAMTSLRLALPKKRWVELAPLVDVVILEPVMTDFDRL